MDCDIGHASSANKLTYRFGNFIGDVVSSDDDSQTNNNDASGAAANNYVYDEDSDDEPAVAPRAADDDDMEIEEQTSNAVILHEDKQYYPTASQIYGEDVETMVQEEDAQPLSEPIVRPVEKKKFQVQELLGDGELPETGYSKEFMADLMQFPEGVRNIAVVGHLHSGKTGFVDMLVEETHNDVEGRLEKRRGKRRDERLRWTDTGFVERERGVSTKCAGLSVVMQGTKGKSFVVNVVDTPGHVDFVDEMSCAMRLVDGVVLVVDVVEGVRVGAERAIKAAVREDLPIVLVVNKMDRLVLELKLPPQDAYFKLKHVVEEVNTIIENTIPGRGEGKEGESGEREMWRLRAPRWAGCSRLPSFAKMYADTYPKVDAGEFGRRLWGDIFFNSRSRKFTKESSGGRGKKDVRSLRARADLQAVFAHDIRKPGGPGRHASHTQHQAEAIATQVRCERPTEDGVQAILRASDWLHRHDYTAHSIT